MRTLYRFDKSKTIFITILLLFLSHVLFSQLNVTVDRADAYYESGDTATFNITSDSSGVINYILKYDNYAFPISTGTVDIIAGEIIPISHSILESGIILCEVTQGQNKSIAAAAFSPFDIVAFADEPSDFDAFWTTQKDNLASIPIDPQVTFYANNDYATTYRVNLANINNRRIYGYISIPSGAGPFPAMITFPSFGNTADLAISEHDLAEKGNVISLSITIHNDEPDVIDSMAYLPNVITDADSFYYKQAVMAGVRCVDYIFSRPDFDGENIIVAGVSQGAGLAILVAGIDDRVNFLINSNPILGQNLGLQNNRAGGFPNYINQSIEGVGTAAHEALVADAAKYYDAIYFARRFQGISWTLISYEDLVTPAATSFAIFNGFQGQKHLTHSVNLGHSHPFDYWNGRFDFMRRFVPGVLDAPFPFPIFTEGYSIDAGSNISMEVTSAANLSGTVEYNSAVNPSFDLVWKKMDGPGDVIFSNENNYNSTAVFSESGIYKLQFSATDYSNNLAENKYYTLVDEIVVTVSDGDSTALQSQIITFNSIPNQLKTNPPFSVNATASSGMPVDFEIFSGPASVSGNLVTLNGTVGTVTIKGSQNGDNAFLPAADVFQSFEVEELVLQTQDISFDPIPNKLTTDAPFFINATANSGLPVNFEIISGPASVSGNLVTLNGTVGTVTIKASQNGDNAFLPAADVFQSFEVEELVLQTQSISFDPIPNKLTTDAPFAINASANSGLPVILEVISGPASINGNIVTLNGNVGTVYIRASQNGNNIFLPAPFVFQSFEVEAPIMQAQNISFDPIPNKLTTDAPFQINAIASSGLPVSFQIIAGPAVNSGNIIALNGTVGTVIVQASQNGNSFFLPAPAVTQIFEVEEIMSLQSQQITFDPIDDKLITDNVFQINATSSSGLPVTFQLISGPAAMVNNWVSLDGTPGTVTIQASQNGNYLFAPAANVTQNFEVKDLPILICENSTNLALRRTTEQSGTQLGATSFRAVDGNINGDFFAENSVTNTDWHENAWWEVDLGSISNIQKINVWNRTDCCHENLKEFYILVSDIPFPSKNLNTILNLNFISNYFIEDIAGSPTKINIDRTGRYVRLQLKNEGAITMTEFEVIGCTDNPNPIAKPTLNEILFYPNPADGFITIKSEFFVGKKVDVMIYTSDGILVLEKTVEEVAEKTFEISTIQLESGAYIIKINSERFNDKTFPFMVMH